MQQKTYVGFHGTSKRRANKIIKNKEYKFSQDSDSRPQWLGDGIYFFENQINWALKYAKEIKKFDSDFAVIKSEINPATVLDLENPDDSDFFQVVTERIIEECVKNGEEIHMINGKVFNFIYNNFRKFDMAKAILLWKPDDEKTGWINIPKYAHTQLCVRNPECIKSYEFAGR